MREDVERARSGEKDRAEDQRGGARSVLVV